MENIIHLLIHVCNVSFATGILPDRTKIAKVNLLDKSGNIFLTTTDKYLCHISVCPRKTVCYQAG